MRPRSTLAALSPRAGLMDGLWLGIAYVLGSQLVPVGQALKSLTVTMDGSGAMVMLGSMGRIALPPIFTSLALDLVLGNARAYRGGIFMLPLVVVATASNLAVALGWARTDDLGPLVLGFALSVAYGVWARRAVHPDDGSAGRHPAEPAELADELADATAGELAAPEAASAIEAAPATAPCSAGRPLAWTLVGGATMVAVASAAVHDLKLFTERWADWGPLGIGEDIPDFHAEGGDGPDLGLDDLPGEVSVLTFWATWCGPCRRELPVIDALAREYGPAVESGRLRFVAVNRDREGDVEQLVRAFKQEHGLDLPVVHDAGSAGRAFRVSMIPHLVLVDRAGRIRHVHQGQVGEGTLRDEIEALLAESAPALD